MSNLAPMLQLSSYNMSFISFEERYPYTLVFYMYVSTRELSGVLVVRDEDNDTNTRKTNYYN